MSGDTGTLSSAAAADLNRAVGLHRAGRVEEARRMYEAVLAKSPEDPNALHLLGRLFLDEGDPAAAEDLVRRAVEAMPAAPFLHTLGVCLARQERDAEAVEAFARAVEIDPALGQAYLEQGLALRRLRRPREALSALSKALEHRPEDVTVLANLALVLLDLRRPDEAKPLLRRALQRSPGAVSLYSALGTAEVQLRNFEGAARALERALAFTPADPVPLGNLGLVRHLQGRIDEAVALYERGLGTMPRRADLLSNRLIAEQYRPGVTAHGLARLHALYHARVEVPLAGARRPHANRRDPDRALRIGYVSPDFGVHPVGQFMAAVLPHHDRARVEVTCYSDRVVADSLTPVLEAAAHRWVSVAELSDAALAERIREDGIDILVDLAGHTARNRLPVFARKPAPVQLTWMGYVGTTGLEAMDALIADRWHVPEGEEDAYRERVLRLPHGYVAYTPPDYMPSVEPLPAAAHGVITFGCLNGLPKINREVAALWARVLEAVPGSSLFLKTDALSDGETRDRVCRLFTEAGVPADHLILEGHTPHRQHLEAYQRVDIALDPFPYSGGLTTIEALWMGVPVVTLTGATFAGRHATSHLSAAGLADTCVATSAEDYVARAVELAADLDGLAALRATLRAQVEASTLADGAGFTRHLEDLFREAWRAWCNEGEG